MIKKIVPFLLFLMCLGFLAKGLQLNPKEMPSAQIGKSIRHQSFHLFQQVDKKTFEDFRGHVLILHFFATWCDSCQQDVMELQKLKANSQTVLLGVFYKDQLNHLQAWQAVFPNLFQQIILDPKGRLGMELGVIATPETFIVDAQGIIRYRYQGPLNQQVLQQKLLPLLRTLNA